MCEITLWKKNKKICKNTEKHLTNQMHYSSRAVNWLCLIYFRGNSSLLIYIFPRKLLQNLYVRTRTNTQVRQIVRLFSLTDCIAESLDKFVFSSANRLTLDHL